MTIKTSRIESIFIIFFILLWVPGYLGLYEPYAEGSYRNVPIWLNIAITTILIFVVAHLIKALSYHLEITDVGLTEYARRRVWTAKWDEIQSWGYSADFNGNYLFLKLSSEMKDRYLYGGFLSDKNLAIIKTEFEKRIGKPIQPQKKRWFSWKH